MKIGILVAAAIFIGGSCFAQELKIKKDDLMIDEKVVAKVSGKGRLYSFSDMSGKLQFKGEIVNGRSGTSTTAESIGWIEFTGTNGNVREVNFADIPFTMSMGKMLAGNALAVGLITKEGINETKVNEFFQTADRSLSSVKSDANKTLKADMLKEDALARENSIMIGVKGNIKTKTGETIGSIEKLSVSADQSSFSRGFSASGMNKYYEYHVFDANKKLVAKLPCSDNGVTNDNKGLKIYTEDGKIWPIQAKTNMLNTSLPGDPIADRMVKKLYANGYLSTSK